MDCLFCKIVKGEIPSFKIYEDNDILVFLDIKPEINGHMLIIPKNHYKDIKDIDSDTLTKVNEIARKMYEVLEKKLNANGATFYQNNGCAQEVKHYHLHLIPRYPNDGVEHYYPKDNLLEVSEVYEILKKC